METEKKNRGIPFKEFLDKSTNLITIFGVLNALFIYSFGIANKSAAEFLVPSFFILSLLVWLELILFAMDSSDESVKYHVFYILACCIEIGFIIFFIHEFAGILYLFACFGLFFLLIYLISKLLIHVLAKYLIKLSDRKRKYGLFPILLLSIIPSAYCLKYTSPYIGKFIERIDITNIQKQDTLVKPLISVDTLRPLLADTNSINNTKVAWTLSCSDFDKRKAKIISSFKPLIIEKTEAENGYVFKFKNDSTTVHKLFEFIKAEKECCSFLNFNITINEDYILLKLTGPKNTKQAIKEIGLLDSLQ